ncbi:hypothetical protein CM240_3026 [Clostridium bornimense]|uniref:Uncharacterized protein n=1 Tax=Clostridium bornimense TaxID=1216932 RepID=W6S084_9CLOT|nr:hypothetical protein CM240_3026 [Clostridium bornimense]
MDYKIADITKKDCEAITDAEKLMKEKTGKDFVLIAWEKN